MTKISGHIYTILRSWHNKTLYKFNAHMCIMQIFPSNVDRNLRIKNTPVKSEGVEYYYSGSQLRGLPNSFVPTLIILAPSSIAIL